MEHNGQGERPISVLVSDAARQLSQLAQQEMDLARLEIRDDVAAAATGAAGFGLAGGAALVGVVFVGLAAMFGLATWLATWVAALIVGGGFLLAAGLFALIGRKAMVRVGPPERTVRTLKEDVECLRHPNN